MVHESQCRTLINHMQEKSISSKEAMELYGIMRLASRISDLKRKGYVIIDWYEDYKKNGRLIRYKRYQLASEEDLT